MKQLLITLLSALLISLTFISCASTPIKEAAAPEEYKITLPAKSENVEGLQFDFIGFKSNINLLSVAESASVKESVILDMLGGDIVHDEHYTSGYEYWRGFRDEIPIKHFPYALEENGIAEDASALYFGDFTPQDLAVYKGNHRYVTFVDIIESHMGWMDTARIQKSFSTVGTVLAVGGIAGFLTLLDTGGDFSTLSKSEIAGYAASGAGVVLGLLCFTPSLAKPKTAFVVRTKYAICIYDTEEKKLVERKLIDFEQEDTFIGSYESNNTEKEMIYNYYSQCLANHMLKEYEKISKKW